MTGTRQPARVRRTTGWRSSFRLWLMCLLLVGVLGAIRITGRAETWRWMFPAENSPVIDAAARNASRPESGPAIVLTAPVPREQWTAVTDRQVGLLRDEAPILQQLIAAASELDASAPDPRARRDLLMAEVKDHPDRFRGELVELRGVLRLLRPCDERLVADETGDLLEGWIFTEESGSMPYRVVTIDAPASIPRNAPIEIPTTTQGYFFILGGYQTQAEFNVAPVLIGRNWWPTPHRPAIRVAPAGVRRMLGWLVLVAIAGSLLALWALTRMAWRGPARGTRPGPQSPLPSTPDWSSLDPAETARIDAQP